MRKLGIMLSILTITLIGGCGILKNNRWWIEGRVGPVVSKVYPWC